MTYRGHIKNGQIHLDEPARLPEGATVEVAVVEGAPASSLLGQIARLAVKGGLPRDYAQQHEHYVKGTPGRDLLKYAGSIDQQTADEMAKAIEDCERIDDEW